MSGGISLPYPVHPHFAGVVLGARGCAALSSKWLVWVGQNFRLTLENALDVRCSGSSGTYSYPPAWVKCSLRENCRQVWAHLLITYNFQVVMSQQVMTTWKVPVYSLIIFVQIISSFQAHFRCFSSSSLYLFAATSTYDYTPFAECILTGILFWNQWSCVGVCLLSFTTWFSWNGAKLMWKWLKMGVWHFSHTVSY